MGSEQNSQTAPATEPQDRVPEWILKDDFSWASRIALLFLIINTIATIWRCRHEPSTVAFVVFCNGDILLLHWCLNLFESASVERKKFIKAAVWILATLLTLAFSHRIAGLMTPPRIAGIIWGMAAISISASFYALFVYDFVGPTDKGKTGLKQSC